jgi:hypothetical protein
MRLQFGGNGITLPALPSKAELYLIHYYSTFLKAGPAFLKQIRNA